MAKARVHKPVVPAVSAVTQRLCGYIATALARSLPGRVVEKAKCHILDTLAAMVSGSRLPPGQAALRYIAGQGGRGEATVVGSPTVTTAVNAALANGMLAHADETDDSHARSLTHPGCAVVPAALAMAEQRSASGAEFIKAVVLGYDVCARTTLALGVDHLIATSRATHALGGVFGASAAAGALAGITPVQARYLLSYTVQQASGVYCWVRDEGHIEKAFDFGGMPARNGVTAATMVASGMTGVADPFSGERNFFLAFSPTGEPEQLSRELGRRFEILDANIKKWSVGSPNQAMLDGLQVLLTEHDIDLKQVERIEIELPEKSVLIVDGRAMPSVCAQHLAAVMMVDRTVSFAATHDQARMKDKAILAVRNKVRLIPNAALPHALRQAVVTIITRDGDRLSHRVEAVRGTTQNPMGFREVAAKAKDLMVPVIGPAKAGHLIAFVQHIDTMPNLRQLRPLLQVRR